MAGGALAAVLLAVGGAGLTGLVHLPFLPKGLHLGSAHPAPALVTVPAIVTNLAGADSSHFAQIAMTVQLADKQQAQAFAEHQPAVQNALIADIRNDSLAALSGTGGMALLRREVATSLDRVLGDEKAVQAVYFTQFIVQ